MTILGSLALLVLAVWIGWVMGRKSALQEVTVRLTELKAHFQSIIDQQNAGDR